MNDNSTQEEARLFAEDLLLTALDTSGWDIYSAVVTLVFSHAAYYDRSEELVDRLLVVAREAAAEIAERCSGKSAVAA
jgi:hypothetical protein